MAKLSSTKIYGNLDVSLDAHIAGSTVLDNSLTGTTANFSGTVTAPTFVGSISPTSHTHSTYDRSSAVLSGANVFSNIVVADGIVTSIATRELTYSNVGAAASSRGVPSGIIVMWSGLISAIPTGWFLCNGLNGTPDLRGRFIYGASIDADVKTTGGSADAIVVSHTHTGPAHTHASAAHTHSTPNHEHTASSDSTGSHNHGYTGKQGNGYPDGSRDSTTTGAASSYARYTQLNNQGEHSHDITVNSGGASTTGSTTPANTGSSGTGNTGSTGSSGTNANLPPYMKLAYIMKG